MWDLVKEFAAWVGWFPISLGAIVTILLGKHFYEREISIGNQRIEHLKDEIEAGKAYQYDEVYDRLTKRVRTLNEELEIVKSETGTKQEKIEEINQNLEVAYSEIRDLHKKLRHYDEQLEDLLDTEPDYCQVCDVDDEHIMMNTISWGYGGEDLVGDTSLVDKMGVCSYCGSTNLKCKICGTITGINYDSSKVTVECEGGCGTLYTHLTFFGDKSMEHTIKVSRMELESDE